MKSCTGDLYVRDILKFLWDLYLVTSSDDDMTTMLDRLEPMSHEEQVLERTVTVEDNTEREEIYTKPRETQDTLVTVTITTADGDTTADSV